MDRFLYTRRLVRALLLLGTVSAGCATASLADGEKTQAPPSDPTPLETQLASSTAAQSQTNQPASKQSSESVVDASAITQTQTDQPAPRQSSESEVNVAAPTTPQTDQAAPRQSDAEAVVHPDSPNYTPASRGSHRRCERSGIWLSC